MDYTLPFGETRPVRKVSYQQTSMIRPRVRVKFINSNFEKVKIAWLKTGDMISRFCFFLGGGGEGAFFHKAKKEFLYMAVIELLTVLKNKQLIKV